MKVKVSEASGPVLDWMVAKCEGKNGVLHDDGITRCIVIAAASGVYKGTWKPSINWSQGGPIIEREHIAISYDAEWIYDPANVDPEDEPDNGDRWYAEIRHSSHSFVGDYGPTPLIAVCRVYVASKLGEEVEVPDELTK